ncbi:MAG: hypothetical protein ICV64_02665 [Thermoleophilia bacterium]|nr:hypothetical protein [Thermoleophilia bacterium]
MRGRSLARAAVAALAVALGGCSTGDEHLTKREYEERVLEIVRGPGREADRLYHAVVAGDLPADACQTQTRELHARLGEVVDEADALVPPAEIEEQHEEFVDAARESVAAVGEAADDVEDGELRCGQPLNERIYGLASTARAVRAIQRLHERGYVRFVLSE